MRTIREEAKYREQLDALALDHKKLDEVLAGVYFAIAKSPEEFPKIPNTELSVAKTDVYPEAPALRIFFVYNPHEVHLICIEFIEDIFHEDDDAVV